MYPTFDDAGLHSYLNSRYDHYGDDVSETKRPDDNTAATDFPVRL